MKNTSEGNGALTQWRQMRVKDLADINPATLLPNNKNVDFFPMHSIGVDGGMSFHESKNTLFAAGYSTIKSGDVVFAKVTPCFENGKSSVVPELSVGVGLATTEITCLRPNRHVNPNFLHYRFKAGDFKSMGINEMKGAGGLKRVPDRCTADFAVLLPPLPEQIAIADYLDKTTALIDKQRALLERNKALLQEHRKALILEAVTKGLTPGVAMKSSGVDWIGDVPNHWKLSRYQDALTHFGKRSGNGMSPGSISFGKVVLKDAEKIPMETAATYQAVFSGDILINPINLNYDLKSLRTALANVDVAVSPAYIVAGPKFGWDPIFLSFLLFCFDIHEMKTLGAGVRQTISFGDIAKRVLARPPIEEQRGIGLVLQAVASRIDDQSNLIKRKSQLLLDLRASIIHEVVTNGLQNEA